MVIYKVLPRPKMQLVLGWGNYKGTGERGDATSSGVEQMGMVEPNATSGGSRCGQLWGEHPSITANKEVLPRAEMWPALGWDNLEPSESNAAQGGPRCN